MEKEKEKEKKLVNFVKNGELRLPPGFRFHPTDEELVVQYLKRKVFSFPLPASIIPDVHVCKSDPWDLPGKLLLLLKSQFPISLFLTQFSSVLLCFWNLSWCIELNCVLQVTRSKRGTSSAQEKQSTPMEADQTEPRILGIGRPRVSTSKSWLQEGITWWGWRRLWFSTEENLLMAPELTGSCTNIASSITPLHRFPSSSPKFPLFPSLIHSFISQYWLCVQNWVLCRIFFKRRSGKGGGGVSGEDQSLSFKLNNKCDHNTISNNTNRPVFYDFLNRTSASSSSATSGITHLSSSHESDENEESSSCNSLHLRDMIS